jgi:hypothetical protein
MQASHDWSQQSSVKETLRVWIDRRAPDPPPASRQVTISAAAQEKQSSEAAAINDAVSKAENDPRLQLLILMVEKLTGLKIKVFDAGQIKAPETVSVPATNAAQPQQPTPRAGFGVEYSRVASYSESEQTSMQAVGVIKTSDGKEIKFSLDLTMQRQYSETSSLNVRLGDAARKTDPLIINFNGTAAQLSEQRFTFDLNSDGKDEQINVPLSGSGFLVLDKNGDGKINSGGELFGPATGNGFSELSKYDNDGNGWIDESDPVFGQLKVWTMGSAGNSRLSDLASLGVGAISLHSIATPFDIKTASNQLLGSIQASSIYVNENGTAGSVQQVDLTV